MDGGKALHLIRLLTPDEVAAQKLAENGDDADGDDTVSHCFTVDEHAAAEIAKIDDYVAVIAISGVYRSGKSFLISRLLGKKGAFKVGNSVSACTKGIWCYSVPLPCTFDDGTKGSALIIDTEGLGSTDTTSHYDDKIFSLATLLSSKLLYNSVGTIDEKSIQKLSFVSKLCKMLSANMKESEDTGVAIEGFVPSFMWLLRDFSLKLVNDDGEPISSDQYMEINLEHKDGFDSATMQRNRVCRMLKNFFKDRGCATMVIPASEESTLQKLASVGDAKLRPKFKQQFQALRDRLFSSLLPKNVSGCPVNGKGFVALCRTYVAAINGGAVPSLSDAWQSAVKVQCQAAMESCLDDVRSLAVKFESGLPVKAGELADWVRSQTSTQLAAYDARAPQKTAVSIKIREQLEESMMPVFKHIEDRNATISSAFCRELFNELFQLQVSVPLAARIEKAVEKGDIDFNDEDSDREQLELLKVIWKGYAKCRKEYNKESVGPKQIVLQELDRGVESKLAQQINIACDRGVYRLSALRNVIKQKEVKISCLTGEMAAIRKELIAEKKNRVTLTAQLVETKKKLEQSETARAQFQEESIKKGLKIDKIKSKLKKRNRELIATKADLKREKEATAAHKQTISNLQESVEELEEYKLTAKHKMRRVFGVVQTMMTTLQSTREQLDQVRRKANSERADITNHVQIAEVKLLRQLKKERRLMKRKEKAMRERIKRVNLKMEATKREGNALRSRFNVLRGEAAQANNNADFGANEAQNLKERLAESLKQKARLEGRLKKMKRILDRKSRISSSPSDRFVQEELEMVDEEEEEEAMSEAKSEAKVEAKVEQSRGNPFGNSAGGFSAEAVPPEVPGVLVAAGRPSFVPPPAAPEPLEYRGLVNVLLSVRAMKMGIAAVKHSWSHKTSHHRWITVDPYEKMVCWSKERGVAAHHCIPIERIDKVTYGYSNLLLKRLGGAQPKWRCFSIRTAQPKRSYDFVCSNDRAALYFCHGLMYLCQSNPKCSIFKCYSLGAMLWTRVRMRLRRRVILSRANAALILKEAILASAENPHQLRPLLTAANPKNEDIKDDDMSN